MLQWQRAELEWGTILLKGDIKLLDKRGFTLIEVLVTVLILSLIVIPIGNLFFQSAYSNKKSKENLLATIIAQDKMEELKAISINELRQRSNKTREEDLTSNNLLFKLRTLVEQEELNLWKITVEVLWEGGEVTLVTYRGVY